MHTSIAPQAMPLFEGDITTPDYAAYARLRSESPVYDHNGLWLVSTHAGCMEVIRDHECFSSRISERARNGERETEPRLLFNDPPDHTRLHKPGSARVHAAVA